jgi:hypothetical protein
MRVARRRAQIRCPDLQSVKAGPCGLWLALASRLVETGPAGLGVREASTCGGWT